MTEIFESIKVVTGAPFFMLSMSTVITVGMLVGGRQDDGSRGFKRSMGVFLPFIFIAVANNLLRIFSLNAALTYQAFNGSVSLIIMGIFYISGLLFGHMISDKGRKDALKV